MLASRLLSVLMGGAAQHHLYEKLPAAVVGPLLFLGLSAYVPIARGVPYAEAAAAAAALAAVGYAIGAFMPRVAAKTTKAKL